jgi:thymidylate synthase (FAD)
MKVIKPSIEYLWSTPDAIKMIESAGRTCYKSENKITDDSANTFVEMLLKNKHEAMIEHASASYKIICDRGVAHEIVRHRLFSYAQESTRYCNYKGGVTFIIPSWEKNIIVGEYLWDQNRVCDSSHNGCGGLWFAQMAWSEHTYIKLLKDGWSPQQARSVLPNSLKTEIVITGNFREWLHFCRLRTSKKAHPQMQEVANMLYTDLNNRFPVVFNSSTVMEKD